MSATCQFFKYELGSQSNQHLTVSFFYDTVETTYCVYYNLCLSTSMHSGFRDNYLVCHLAARIKIPPLIIHNHIDFKDIWKLSVLFFGNFRIRFKLRDTKSVFEFSKVKS